MANLDPNQLVDAQRIYARSGIAAATTINSGALLAALTQIEHLASLSGADSSRAVMCWAGGVGSATFAWLAAFAASTYHVEDRRIAGHWASAAGMFLFVVSLELFIAGFAFIARTLLP